MISVKGYLSGWTGLAGGTPAGANRAARSHGQSAPTVTGKKGQGRASTLRSYTVTVTRQADGQRLEETIGPGYHSKAHWQKEIEECQKRLLRQLGWRG